MNKAINLHNALLLSLLIAVVCLTYSNSQLINHNQALSEQVADLSTKLNSLSTSSEEIENRITEIEDNMSIKYRGLARHH